MLQLVTPTTFLIVDSTPLVDLYDMEAGWGHTSRGKFRGLQIISAKKVKRCKIDSGGLLKKKLYVVKQFNGHLKGNFLGNAGFC